MDHHTHHMEILLENELDMKNSIRFPIPTFFKSDSIEIMSQWERRIPPPASDSLKKQHKKKNNRLPKRVVTLLKQWYYNDKWIPPDKDKKKKMVKEIRAKTKFPLSIEQLSNWIYRANRSEM
jgi:hypothetical protein